MHSPDFALRGFVRAGVGALVLAATCTFAFARSDTITARFTDAFSPNVGGWSLTPAANTPVWQPSDRGVVVTPARVATAHYTIPAGAAGFYAITDSFLQRSTENSGAIALRVDVVRHGHTDTSPRPIVTTNIGVGESFDCDAFLGYLLPGDEVRVSLQTTDNAAAQCEIAFTIARVPHLPVSEFPADFTAPVALDAPGGWSIAEHVGSTTPAARRLAWSPARDARIVILPDARGGTLVSFRVPQSGYYALHDAWFAPDTAPVEAQIYVSDEAAPRRNVRATRGARASLDADLGYVARGDVIHLAFVSPTTRSPVHVDLSGSIVEWAPRRAPLRVRRGDDGLFDVFEPEAPRRAVDIPAANWITIAAREGDATEALREGFARARALQRGSTYVGLRLERGKTYTIATGQVGGAVFNLRDAERIVLDGNGATLRIASEEIVRRGIELFFLGHCRNMVFADLTIEATTIPFTTGKILDVSPRGSSTQTVTFRVDPGALDPLRDISPAGINNAYAYDPKTPGRLALGAWTHYPGSGRPSIHATDTPGVYTHRVTRTGDSIEPGSKWLVKNKPGGVVYLVTRFGTENVTLSGIDGRASGGGMLRFWHTSGINILDCRFEPDGDNWISSSSDGVHGRAREGVWIENTLFRGICEDIMNTYGQNMVVIADDNDSDTTISIRMLQGSVESRARRAQRVPEAESIAAGDQLVFFAPSTGQVLGQATVVSGERGRYTLSQPVAGIVPWEEGNNGRATMVYNTRVAARFFIRDSRFMDSMRFGVYIKARGGVVFGSQFEGLSAPGIFATNEPEWPEGPPATHLWVQGCTFSQNNHGFMPRHRDFMVVDPADISVYTRKFRGAGEPNDHRAHLTRGQFANSHLRFAGNVFHDWRGMGISVRNAHNVHIEDNLFLPPVDDAVMRKTLGKDPALGIDGRGTYAAIFLDTADGVRVSGNRFHHLGADNRGLVAGEDVTDVVEMNNATSGERQASVLASASFNEWFGATSAVVDSSGRERTTIRLGSAVHRAGKLGAGLAFNGGDAAIATIDGNAIAMALWVRPQHADGNQVVFVQGNADQRAEIMIRDGRWRAAVSVGGQEQTLDLGPAVGGLWQHIVLGFDGGAQTVRAFVDGVEMASAAITPRRSFAFSGAVALGGSGESRADRTGFHGVIDDVRWLREFPTAADIGALALRIVP